MILNLVWTLVACDRGQPPGPDPTLTDPTTDTTVPPDDGLTDAERAALADELERTPAAADTPSAMGHFHVGRQASTYVSGPTSPDAEVTVRYFETETGSNVGASPWHVVNPQTYGVDTHTLWGVSITKVYKVSLDDAFQVLDTFPVNTLPTSIPWNLVALANGRLVVPDPNGYLGGHGGTRCTTTDPTFITVGDDPSDLSSEILCDQVFELTEARVRAACGISDGTYEKNLSGIPLTLTFTGELVTDVVFENEGTQTTYFVVMSDTLDSIVGCEVLDEGLVTNALPAERLGPEVTAFYAITEQAMVQMTYDASTQTAARAYVRDVPVRFRAGTTPTLVDTPDGEQLVVFIDAKCAVQNVINGLIVCNDDTAPSQVVAVRRPAELEGRPAVVTTDLPAWLDTVENSPSARGDIIVVANYTGYLPNGLKVPPGGEIPEGGPQSPGVSPDAVEDVASGLVALQWSPSAGRFEILWEQPDRQVSGVTAISGGANMVYGSGAEQATGKTYLYGFRLRSDADGPAGEERMRIELADAPFRTPRTDRKGTLTFRLSDFQLEVGELFDQGNNIVITPDRSVVVSGGSGLARIRDPDGD